MGNGMFRARKRTALARSKSFQTSPAAAWWDGRERNWMMEVWDLLRPMSEGRWWAWAALAELTRDFEQASKRLTNLIFNEIGLETRMKLLPPDLDGVYRAYNIEIVLTPHDTVNLKDMPMMSEEMLSVQALWRSRPTQFVPPLLFIVDCQGARCMARSAPPKASKVVFGPGSRAITGGSATVEMARIGKGLNLKSHNVPASILPGQQYMGFETVFSSDTAVMGGPNGIQFIAKVSSIFPLELVRKKKNKVKQKDEEPESESDKEEQVEEEPDDEEAKFISGMSTSGHIRAWLEDMDVKKMTKKELRELVARRDAGEAVTVPPEVEEMLMSKSEMRLKRISEMVDGQYSSKRLISGERHLRPELVASQESALNADAHEPWNLLGVSKQSEDARAVFMATEGISLSLIPQMSMILDGRMRAGEVGWTREKLRSEMHSRGIGMRNLGFVLGHVWEAPLRLVVLTEMTVRVFKNVLRQRLWAAMEACRGHSRQPCLDAAAEFLQLAFGSDEASKEFWYGVQDLLEAKYSGYNHLTLEQQAMMREWEKCAEAITNPETRREYAQLQQMIRRLGKDCDEAVIKRLDVVKAHLEKNIDRERELRVKIDQLVEPVKEQIDLQLLLEGVLASCGLKLVHNDPKEVLRDCQRGILASTDIVEITPISKSLRLAEAADAIQTLLRTKEERHARREKDLDRAVVMLGRLLDVNRHDWLLLSFYADALVLRLGVTANQERLTDLRLAYASYMRCVRMSPTAHQHLLEAGGVLYEILSLKPDDEAEQQFLSMCKSMKVAEFDPKGYQRHLNSWVQIMLDAFHDARGQKALRLGELAGKLILQSFHHESQGVRSTQDVLRDRGLEWTEGLKIMDLVAALELGKQVANIANFATQKKKTKQSWLPKYRRRGGPQEGDRESGRALNITNVAYISEEALERLLMLGQNLESFCAEKCAGVASKAMDLLVEQHKYSLMDLHLTLCRQVDQDAMVKVAASCVMLTSLTLSGQAHLVTNELMEQACPHLTGLTSIDLSHASRLGNEGVKAIGGHCTELRSISLEAVPQIDDVGFVHIVRNCQKITSLNLRGSAGITGRSVVEMAMRTHSLFMPRKRSWVRPGFGVVVVRGTEENQRRPVHEEDGFQLTAGSAKPDTSDEEEIPEEIDERKYMGFEEALKLSEDLFGHQLDIETIERMFLELDGVEGSMMLTHMIRIERVNDFLLNGTDYQLPIINTRLRGRNVENLFKVFAQKNAPPSKVARNPETLQERHGMDPDEFLSLLRHLNIVPAYLSSFDVVHIYAVIMRHANAVAKAQKEAADLADGTISFWSDKLELGVEEFRKCFDSMAKLLCISPNDLSRLSRSWLEAPMVSREDIVYRIPFVGSLRATRTDSVKQKERRALALHIYIGAIKVSRNTLEVLDQPGISLVAVHIKAITSWGPEYMTQKYKEYTSEVHDVHLKASIVRQEYWLMEFDEHLEIQMLDFEDHKEFDHATITIQLILTTFNATKVHLLKKKANAYQDITIASVTLALPSFVDTDARFQWLAFSQFQGMKVRGHEHEEREGEVDAKQKTEEQEKLEEFNVLKMPPAMRMQYRVLGKETVKLFLEKKAHYRELRSKQARERWKEGMKERLRPGYLRKKVENRSEQVVDIVMEQTIDDMFKEFDLFGDARIMRHLDLSHTNINTACLQELLQSFDGLRSISLQNCTAVAGSRIERLAQRAQSLTKLDVKGCTNLPAIAVNELTTACPLLSYVDLCMVGTVFDSTIANLSRCQNLTCLKISGCLNIPDTGFVALLDCKSLTELKIGGCAQVSEKVFMGSVGKMSKLLALDVSFMDCVTDASLDLVLRSNSRLTSLNISNNNVLTDQALDSLSRFGRKLCKLKMSGNENFSDKGAESLVLNCEALQKLSLAQRHGACLEAKSLTGARVQDISLTDRVLGTLAAQGADLQELDICGCVGTTVDARNKLIKVSERKGL